MSHWAAKYIGLPYVPGGREKDGVDCWGLLRLIYKEEMQLDLPLLPGVVDESLLAISRRFESASNWFEISAPEDGCAVAMSKHRFLHHVGIWAEADGGKVIHCWSVVATSSAETIRSLRVKGFKVIKFFRYGLHH